MLDVLLPARGNSSKRTRLKQSKRSRGFRPDIQGLRAFAVIAVILDHLVHWPSGGFVGVDIFFVISGFLITGHLLREHEKTGRISLLDFYKRRVKRILPASTLALVVTVAVSYAIFNASRFKETALDGVWAALFSANWRFGFQGTDYFQQGGAVSPLQHYWSLAVEEQFYFVWPLLMLGALALVARSERPTTRRVSAGIAMVVVAALSFGWAMLETASNPGLAYFSTLSRAWELGAGALLAIFAGGLTRLPAAIRPAIAWIGLALMTYSVFAISGDSPFPAPAALLPVVGTVLVIGAGCGTTEHRYLAPLTNPVSRYLGDISFSLYLWHFPVIIVGAQLLDTSTPAAWALLTALYVGLAVFAYHLVEDPVRKSSWLSPKPKVRTRPWESSGYKHTALGALASLTLVFVLLALIPPKQVDAPAVAALPNAGLANTQGAPTASALPPELGKLQGELRAAVATTEWPSLEPSFEAAIDGGQAPDDIAPCGFKDRPINIADCTWGDANASQRAVIVGDSTSMGYVAGLRQAVKARSGWAVTSMGTFGCPFHQPSENLAAECKDRIAGTVSAIQNLRPTVLFVTNSSASTDREGMIAALIRTVQPSVGKIVYLMPPPAEKALEDCYSKVSTPADCISKVDAKWTTQAAWEKAEAQRNGWAFVPSDQWFCVDGYCPPFAGNIVTKKDLHHATPAYQERIGPVMTEALTAMGIFG